jgi:hypothetical protein
LINIAVTIFEVIYVLVGFWKPYTGQVVGREWDVMDLIGGVKEVIKDFSD